MALKYPAMSVAANMRIEAYDKFRRELAVLNNHEETIERLRRVLEDAKKFEWFGVPMFSTNMIQSKVTLAKTERMADMGPLIERIEDVVGPCTSTSDEAEMEYWTRRRFCFTGGPLKFDLIVEVTKDNMTCKRVPTGETEVVQKFRLVCEEAA